MKNNKKTLTSKLLDEDIIHSNKTAIESVAFYTKNLSIIERAQIAMGKKKPMVYIASATNNDKLNTDVFVSTH